MRGSLVPGVHLDSLAHLGPQEEVSLGRLRTWKHLACWRILEHPLALRAHQEFLDPQDPREKMV